VNWDWVLPLAIGLAAFGFIMDRIEKKLNRIIQLLERDRH
jgi:hypothetical protein